MPNASISLPTAHTMASIDPVSSSTFQGRRDKWYTTHDTSSTRSPFENDVLFGQIHTNTRKHACPTRSSALNELKHTRNTNQVVCVSIFRQETRYTTRAPRHPPFENYVLFGQMHAINGVLTRTSDVLICQLLTRAHEQPYRQKINLKCIRARACGAAHDTSTSRMKYTHKHLTITVQGRQALRPGPHDPRSRTTNSSTGHTLIDAKRNSTIPTRKRGRRNDELKTRRIYRLGRDVDATTRYRPGTCTDQGEM